MTLLVDDFCDKDLNDSVQCITGWLDEGHAFLLRESLQVFEKSGNAIGIVPVAVVIRQIMTDLIERTSPQRIVAETHDYRRVLEMKKSQILSGDFSDIKLTPNLRAKLNFAYGGSFGLANASKKVETDLCAEVSYFTKIYTDLNRYAHPKSTIFKHNTIELEEILLRYVRGLGRFISFLQVSAYRLVSAFVPLISDDIESFIERRLESAPLFGEVYSSAFARQYDTRIKLLPDCFVFRCAGIIYRDKFSGMPEGLPKFSASYTIRFLSDCMVAVQRSSLEFSDYADELHEKVYPDDSWNLGVFPERKFQIDLIYPNRNVEGKWIGLFQEI